VRLPHEILAEIFRRDPKQVNPLAQDSSEWDVPVFREHTVVRSFGVKNTVPVTLYSDSTPMSKNDNLYTVYMQIAWSRERHLLFCVRKSTLCKCSCKGYAKFNYCKERFL
jgi:hypothetical protein